MWQRPFTKGESRRRRNVQKSMVRDWSKSIGGGGVGRSRDGVGRSRDGVGHEVFSLVQGVGRAIFSYP